MDVIRIIGWIMMLGVSALLGAMWSYAGIPVSPEDWAACIAINMCMLIIIVGSAWLAFFPD